MSILLQRISFTKLVKQCRCQLWLPVIILISSSNKKSAPTCLLFSSKNLELYISQSQFHNRLKSVRFRLLLMCMSQCTALWSKMVWYYHNKQEWRWHVRTIGQSYQSPTKKDYRTFYKPQE